MDYDQSDIAAVYDRARGLAPDTARAWMDLFAAHVDRNAVALIVDLGCGTGRFCEALAAYFDANVIGVDPSEKMLAQACRKPANARITFARGSGEAIPVADGTADMIFMSMVFHHFQEPARVAQECRRILRPGGRACVRNSTREADFAYRCFFPGMQSLMDSALPGRRDFQSVFESAGFAVAAHGIVHQMVAPNWESFVEKSSLRADSLLARLAHEDFAVGMARLRAHAAKADPSQAITEEVNWFVFTRRD